MTIKAFLKNEEKKRSKEGATPQSHSINQATPAPAPSQTPAPATELQSTSDPSKLEKDGDEPLEDAYTSNGFETADAAPGEAVLSVEVCFPPDISVRVATDYAADPAQ